VSALLWLIIYLACQSNIESDLNSLFSISTIFGNHDIPVLLSSELQAITADDTLMQMALRHVSEGWCAKALLPPELKPYYDVRETLSCNDENLLTKDSVVVIPQVLRTRVLELAHEGHPGVVKMKQRCRTTVWWPGMNNDIEHYVRHCAPCAVSGKSLPPVTPPLQPIEFPPSPWHTVAIDIFGEVTWAPAHQRFIIVLVDRHTKWPEVAVCGTVTSTSVTNFLTDLFCRHGLPDNLISDNGPQFCSAEFKNFLSSLGVHHSKTAVYNPSANGAVGRFNKVLKEGLSVACAESASFLPSVKRILANYRSLRHTTTGESPAKMLYGREMRMPFDCVFKKKVVQTSPKVKKRLQFAQNKAKRYTDQVRHAPVTVFKTEDWVRTLRPFRKHKLETKWSHPKEVTVVRGATLTLADGKRWNVRKCIPCRPDSANDADITVEVEAPTQHPQTPPASPPASPPIPILRRSTRSRHPPNRYSP
jgi:transposase InsO family protein